MVVNDTAIRSPILWIISPFKYVRERLKSVVWKRSALLCGGAVSVYLLYCFFTSGSEHKPDSKKEHPRKNHLLRLSSKMPDSSRGTLDNTFRSSSHRKTFSSPLRGTPSEDKSSQSEEMYSADPNYSSSSLYIDHQKVSQYTRNRLLVTSAINDWDIWIASYGHMTLSRDDQLLHDSTQIFKNKPVSMFSKYSSKEDGRYEQSKTLETLKHNYEQGLIPSILTKSRHSISNSFKAIFRYGEGSERSATRLSKMKAPEKWG